MTWDPEGNAAVRKEAHAAMQSRRLVPQATLSNFDDVVYGRDTASNPNPNPCPYPYAHPYPYPYPYPYRYP